VDKPEKSHQSGLLFVVATPIGNLEDITLRALRLLGEVDVIAAEDTRVTAKLLKRHEISTPLLSLREQNASKVVGKLVATLQSGNNVALVTDAGTPSVSDPGFDLVSASVAARIKVVPIPGPSALSAAVSVSGLKGDGIRFHGFLPRAGKLRREALHTILEDRALAVIYESPNRIDKTLAELAAIDKHRRAAVMRELTKVHEDIVRGTLHELSNRFQEKTLGEITLIIEGENTEDKEELSETTLLNLIQNALEDGRSAKDIATSLSKGLGIPRKRIYDTVVTEISKQRT
jgi:16S rRNA (cytidine1402-2'-O)-methyltransferase